ncbi:MAG: class I SAM-dependent methyltransferase [Pseudonocardiaceae bacterium]|nr:class I SAM-dependent methyltransferase [Pseudonocardiaceae bacterium]
MLGLFASVVRGPALDVGCGTGLATAHLHDLGVAISGLDLSPGMVAVARSSFPALAFTVGSMLSLPVPSGALGGVLAWYSTIHVPDDLLPRALAEFQRVLAPGGHLLLAFQVGDEPLHLTSGLGHAITLDFHRRRPSRVAGLLRAAGLPVRARTVREAEYDAETTPQAFLLAHKPA